MLRDRKGKVKGEYEKILLEVDEPIRKLVNYLMIERKLTPEEVIGLISGSATLTVGAVGIKMRMNSDGQVSKKPSTNKQ